LLILAVNASFLECFSLTVRRARFEISVSAYN
jgi:hypothetical protein